MYDYQTELAKIFTPEGMDMLLTLRDNAAKLFETAGAARFDKLTRGLSGDSWTMLACLDYLVERGDMREVTAPDVLGQHRVFVRCGN